MSIERKDCGGIRDLQGLKNRCRIDEDTGCWIWTGAVQRRTASVDEPRVWLAAKNRTETLGRAAMLLSGNPAQPGQMVWRKACTSLCGNPDHLKTGTRKQWGDWVKKRGHLRGRPERSIINRRIKLETQQTVLSEELAQWVRESEQTGIEVAHAIGCSRTAVSRVRLGKSWKVGPIANSVFNMTAANMPRFREAA